MYFSLKKKNSLNPLWSALKLIYYCLQTITLLDEFFSMSCPNVSTLGEKNLQKNFLLVFLMAMEFLSIVFLKAKLFYN